MSQLTCRPPPTACDPAGILKGWSSKQSRTWSLWLMQISGEWNKGSPGQPHQTQILTQFCFVCFFGGVFLFVCFLTTCPGAWGDNDRLCVCEWMQGNKDSDLISSWQEQHNISYLTMSFCCRFLGEKSELFPSFFFLRTTVSVWHVDIRVLVVKLTLSENTSYNVAWWVTETCRPSDMFTWWQYDSVWLYSLLTINSEL